MPLSTISNSESGSSTRSKINAAIAAINNTAHPSVIYVTTTGNDTTGDGSIGSPFLTPDKALAVAVATGGAHVIDLGVGAFTSTYGLTHAWPATVTLRGAGVAATSLSLSIQRSGSTNSSVTVRAPDLSLTLAGRGADGAEGANGDSGPELIVIDSVGPIAYSDGGNGGPGAPGANYTYFGGSGGNGGNGGSGGYGGNIILIRSHFTQTLSRDGSLGSGGSGGVGDTANGGMDGEAGADGLPGARGMVTLLRSHGGQVDCYQLHWSCSEKTDNSTIDYGGGSDFGGNSTIPAGTYTTIG